MDAAEKKTDGEKAQPESAGADAKKADEEATFELRYESLDDDGGQEPTAEGTSAPQDPLNVPAPPKVPSALANTMMGLQAPTEVPADMTESPSDAPSLSVSDDAAPVVGKPDVVENSNWRPSNWFLFVTAFLVAVADLGSKEWAKWAIAGPDLKRTGRHIEVIPNHLDFIFAQNPGGAWSFLRGVPDGLRRPFFLFVSSAAIVFIVGVYRRLDKQQWAMRWGLPLALGGAIGNLVDRARYGWVCDFIDVYWKGKSNEMHWPTFNVADIAIVVGVLLMALDLNLLRKPKTPQEAKPTPEPAGTVA